MRKTREKSKGKSKGTKSANQGAKGSHEGKTSKTGLSGLENSKSETNSQTPVPSHRKLKQLFFYSGGVNFLMQLQFLAPVELFFKQLNGYSF